MRCGQSLLIEKHRFVGFDQDGGFPANIAASDWPERAKQVEQLNTERAKRVEQLDTEYAVARDRGLN